MPPAHGGPGRYPTGVAPLAATAIPATPLPARARRPRMVVAAAVTGAMALMPLAGPTALARERDRHEMRVASAELFLRQKAAEPATSPAEPAPGQADGAQGKTRTEPRPGAAAPGGRGHAAPAPAAPAAEEPGAEAAAGADTPPAAAGDAEDEAAPAGPTGPEEPAADQPAPRAPTPIAAVSGIRLLVPSMQTVLVGFHEAAMPGSLPMASVAPLEANHNPGAIPEIAKTQPHQVAPVMVLPTRARAQAPSTAIDIAIPAGEEVLAPIDGTVTAVLPYTLYGQHADVRVEIEPAGRPDLRVVLIHVSGVEVEVGDTLTGGETVVAGSATQFPFDSQIDRFTEEIVGRALPHVHVEVRPTG